MGAKVLLDQLLAGSERAVKDGVPKTFDDSLSQREIASWQCS
ncbi:hypothetical protein C7S13_4725 [Burkholderia cepacia]|nr:hypothetical protein [Burkholderia cepacia]